MTASVIASFDQGACTATVRFDSEAELRAFLALHAAEPEATDTDPRSPNGLTYDVTDAMKEVKRLRAEKTFYAEAEIFSSLEVELRRRAAALVAQAVGKMNGEWVRCHELTRAVGSLLDLSVVDGKYLAIEHSWLLLDKNHILDVYVPGRLPQVQLVDTTLPRFVSDYVPSEPRADINHAVIERLQLFMRGGSL